MGVKNPQNSVYVVYGCLLRRKFSRKYVQLFFGQILGRVDGKGVEMDDSTKKE